jgi:hypothetical protein
MKAILMLISCAISVDSYSQCETMGYIKQTEQSNTLYQKNTEEHRCTLHRCHQDTTIYNSKNAIISMNHAPCWCIQCFTKRKKLRSWIVTFRSKFIKQKD